MIYLIGSLRNDAVPLLAKDLRVLGHDVFDDWFAAGPEADDRWAEYEKSRNRTYVQGLAGKAAAHVFEFDKANLDAASIGVLLLPAGRSGHLELGYMAGSGKETHIVLGENYDRWDVMYKFATFVWEDVKEFLDFMAGRVAAIPPPAVDDMRPINDPDQHPHHGQYGREMW